MTRVCHLSSLAGASRFNFENSLDFSPAQIQIDSFVGSFSREASNSFSIASMTFAGLAGRFARMGLLAAGSRLPLRNLLSHLGSIGVEAASFEGMIRMGEGGRRAGDSFWHNGAHHFINFSTFRFVGILAHTPHFFIQHLSQSIAMVAGHQMASALGLEERSPDSFAQQLLEASLSTLQIQAGSELGNKLSGGRIQMLENHLELEGRAIEARRPRDFYTPRGLSFSQASVAMEGRGFERGEIAPSRMVAESEVVGRSHPKSKKGPSGFYLYRSLEHFEAQLRQFLASVPAEQEKVEIQVEALKLGSVNRFTALIRKALKDAAHLERVIVRYRNGAIEDFMKDERGVVHDYFEEECEEDARLLSLEEASVLFVPPWRASEKNYLPTLLKQARKKKGWSQRQVAEALRELTGAHHTPEVISTYETHTDSAITFEALRSLAFLYGEDIRRLIVASNKSRFPQVNADEWSTDFYPLYIESAADLRRLSYYREKDPQHRGLGWRIYATRKNPYAYCNTVQLAERLGMAPRIFTSLELDEHYPEYSTLQALTRSLGLPLAEAIGRANAIHHPDLALKDLFPGLPIYISPYGDDREKILGYQRHPRAPGKILFAYRKAQEGNVDAATLSKQFERYQDYWADCEHRMEFIQSHEMKKWMWLFNEIGEDTAILERGLEEQEKGADNPALLLASALGEENLLQCERRTGISRKVLGKILNSTPQNPPPPTQDATIARIQQHVLGFEADLFYRAIHPELSQIFPETSGEDPFLSLTPALIEEAAQLRLGDRLHAYRMKQGVSLAQMAKKLGVGDRTIYQYENTVGQIENVQVMIRLAQTFGLSPRLLYLHFHPRLLMFFRIVNPETSRTFSVSEADYERLASIQRPDSSP